MSPRTLAFAGIALFSTVALAQDRGAEQRVEYRRTTIINIGEDEVVDGNFDRPGESLIESIRPLRHVSMIPNRSDFIAELCKSVENY